MRIPANRVSSAPTVNNADRAQERGAVPARPALDAMEARRAQRVALQTPARPRNVKVGGAAEPKAGIEDLKATSSTVEVKGAVTAKKVSLTLDLEHTWPGDLVVKLVAPSGKTETLFDRKPGAIGEALSGTWDVSAAFAGELADGGWTLKVEDQAGRDVGVLNRWALELEGEPVDQPGKDLAGAEPHAAIEDLKSTSSTAELGKDLVAKKVFVSLDVEHTWPGDLVVKLRAPSGKTETLYDRKPGAIGDVKGRFEVSEAFAGELARGGWTLTVEDQAGRDVGVLHSWSVEVEGEPAAPVENPDSDPMKHIEYLASEELRGRDSPSPGLDAAAAHIAGFAKKYGLEGPNPSDPRGAYYQSFDLYQFTGQQPEDETEYKKFGSRLFEHGFYVDETLSPNDLRTIERRREELRNSGGLIGTPTRINDTTDLKRASEKTGEIQNVMGMLKGTGPNKDEVIVVMAHYDHVGVNSNGTINYGADDNASGSGVLMSMIPQLAEAQKRGELDRSILFLWTGAEEKGLVGAKYFADHPIPGLGMDKIAGVVNADMLGRWDDQRLSVIDSKNGKPNYLSALLEEANRELPDPFDRINRDINQYSTRQDGAIFSKLGEDVLFLFEGLSNPNGGGNLHPDYHRNTDTVDKIYRDNKGEKPRRVRDLLAKLLVKASTRQVEQWR